jgi:hypothetical protein
VGHEDLQHTGACAQLLTLLLCALYCITDSVQLAHCMAWRHGVDSLACEASYNSRNHAPKPPTTPCDRGDLTALSCELLAWHIHSALQTLVRAA